MHPPQIGLNTERIRFRQHLQHEMAHYAEVRGAAAVVGLAGSNRDAPTWAAGTRHCKCAAKRLGQSECLPVSSVLSCHLKPPTHPPTHLLTNPRTHPPIEPQDCWDFEVECSYGWVECAGLADRSAYDLTVRGRGVGGGGVLVGKPPAPLQCAAASEVFC